MAARRSRGIDCSSTLEIDTVTLTVACGAALARSRTTKRTSSVGSTLVDKHSTLTVASVPRSTVTVSLAAPPNPVEIELL